MYIVVVAKMLSHVFYINLIQNHKYKLSLVFKSIKLVAKKEQIKEEK